MTRNNSLSPLAKKSELGIKHPDFSFFQQKNILKSSFRCHSNSSYQKMNKDSNAQTEEKEEELKILEKSKTIDINKEEDFNVIFILSIIFNAFMKKNRW